ncbi:MAG: hypothetical protein WDN49_15830 [Acetobacteraceae bacterium]
MVVDPYRTGTAAAADMHLAVRPGTDGALACAVMHAAFRDGYADRAYMAAYADCPDALEAHLATRSPAWAAGITGLAESRNRGVRAGLQQHPAQLYPPRLRLQPGAERGGHAARPSPACRR